MSDPFARLRRFLRELKRRNVYQVAVTYAVVGFVLIQVADLTFVRLGLPSWTVTLVIVLVAMGFPLALVLAWAFERTPEGVRRTADAEGTSEPESMSPEERRTQSRLAMKALVGLGLLGAAVAGGWYLMGGGGESPEIAERTVAVLPFEVTGSGTEDWREGMVTMVSTGLDGAAGLRAIADRTVLSAWKRRGQAQPGASTEEALSVARQIGAQYAVVGSAGGMGSELRFAAAVHETETGERLGQVEVRGSPDSVTALADGLTRRVIGLLAEETNAQLGSADLAAVTTPSVPALKSYLEGLHHRRAGDPPQAAVEDFEAAIRADSTFALPYAQIAFLGLWRPELEGQAMQRAYELSAQLPERERRLIRALHLERIEHRTLAAADSVRKLTRAYPDDPSIWRVRGELIRHAYIPGGTPESEQAHERVVSLDPENTSAYAHYVNPTFFLHHDSALAAGRLDSVPVSDWRRMYRLGLEVVFGKPETRRRALARYDTVSVPVPWLVWAPYLGPEDRDHLDTVLRRVLERDDLGDSPYREVLFLNDLDRGHVQQALSDLPTPGSGFIGPTCGLAYSLTVGLPIPDSVARNYLEPENLPVDPSVDRLHCTGLYLAEQGRGGELDSLIGRIRAATDTTALEGPSQGKVEAVVEELKGYRAWKAGDLKQAAELWSRSNESWDWGAIWRGDVHMELGQLQKAEGWYRAPWVTAVPVAHERLGRLYAEMGRPEDAAAAYRRFIAAWQDADPELQDRVEAARERLEELKGSGTESDG